ncbi:calmodulin-like [Prunus yedoensis var. nudiflora]|uniref:Calmodulin-like n=1 Tax=Prunus yedoensis var. nudiflora TaxID=2094558 RepID=A0A314YIR7_PRUYE|nr:calmodulin-like [Prunus yedoensis var. nudiflora]
MSHELSEEQVEELKQAFDTFDKDGNGTITTDELSNVMTSLGQSPSEEDLEEFIQQLGGDDGRVRFDQFLNFSAKFLNTQ